MQSTVITTYSSGEGAESYIKVAVSQGHCLAGAVKVSASWDGGVVPRANPSVAELGGVMQQVNQCLRDNPRMLEGVLDENAYLASLANPDELTGEDKEAGGRVGGAGGVVRVVVRDSRPLLPSSARCTSDAGPMLVSLARRRGGGGGPGHGHRAAHRSALSWLHRHLHSAAGCRRAAASAHFPRKTTIFLHWC